MKTKGYKKVNHLFCILLTVSTIACNSSGGGNTKQTENMKTNFEEGSYGYDVDFLSKHNIKTIELKDTSSNACVLIVPDFQGRVMTSSSDGNADLSFGWINYKLIESGEIKTQFNPYGGEERIWLGPEGGLFSIYFKKGVKQDFDHWQVPKEIDTEAFDVVSQTLNNVRFKKEFDLMNYSGIPLKVGIERTIKILSIEESEKALQLSMDKSLKFVAYESENILINRGTEEWKKESGLLSIWLLSMFRPSPDGIVFIPFKEGSEKDMGKKVSDDYFGKVPADRLIVNNNMLFFKIDGKFRSKIGISPKRALPFCGSYDEKKHVLTVLWYSKPDEILDYVNSKWGKQDDPYSGDVINSYNDGPVEDGSIMGPFYEIESSSPAAKLKPGDKITHNQRIFHFIGTEDQLNPITEKLFNISIAEIKQAFKK